MAVRNGGFPKFYAFDVRRSEGAEKGGDGAKSCLRATVVHVLCVAISTGVIFTVRPVSIAIAMMLTFAAGLAGATAQNVPPEPATPFHFQAVKARAAALSKEEFQRPPAAPSPFANYSYDDYRRVSFRPDAYDWANIRTPFAASSFQLNYLARGFIFNDEVKVNLVRDGVARPRPYRPEEFRFDGVDAPEEASSALGFSGLRVLTPLNKAGLFDELIVFQGASYFRALHSGAAYGVSARGLAIDTAEKTGEEFPVFREFWVVEPAIGAREIMLYALMDSPRVTGAFQFIVRPGVATVVDVDAIFYPRADLAHVGVAPMSSMFFFGPQDRRGVDDFRPSVHDSDGLLILTKAGESIWRPLVNPAALEVSSFTRDAPLGFGLMQRARDFSHFSDLEAHYERRPSIWIQPKSDWGAGEVSLLEIPTNSEVHDNIAVYWRPSDVWKAGEEKRYQYAIHWAADAPQLPTVARIASTRIGRRGADAQIVIDFDGAYLEQLDGLNALVEASAGRVRNISLQRNDVEGGLRLSFDFDPQLATLSELRVVLTKVGAPVSETWLYRWTRS